MMFTVRRLSNPDKPIQVDILGLDDLLDFIISCDVKLQHMGKERNGIAIKSENGRWVITIID